MRKAFVKLALLALVLAGPLVSATFKAAADEKVKRGAYLAAIMACTDCHTPGHFLGKADKTRFLAGGDVGFFIPDLGYFYPPNLTPDKETGLGKWSEADIVKAVRTGERPDGRMIVPSMPWITYATLTDDDARALAAYLKSLKPIRNQVPAIKGAAEKPTAPYLKVVIPE